MMKKLRIRIEPGDVIIEMLSIVVAILLALAVNNWQEHLRQEALLRENVENIVHELQVNQRALAALTTRNEAETRAFDREVVTLQHTGERMDFDGFSAFFRRTAPDGIGLLQLQDVAWSVAQSDQSLAIMPTDERIMLASVYAGQDHLRLFYRRLADTLDIPESGDWFVVLASADVDFGDVVSTERSLLVAYGHVIPILTTRYGITSSR